MDDRPLSADRVPTLTEVVELDLPASAPSTTDLDADAPPSAAAEAAVAQPMQHSAAAGETDVDLDAAATGPLPPAMADDFVLSGLNAEAVEPCSATEVTAAPTSTVGGLAPAAGGAEVDTSPAEVPGSPLAVATVLDGADDLEGPAGPGGPLEPPVPPAASTVAAPASVEAPMPVALPVVDVDAVVAQVLSELMPRIDMLLESRLREALAPALARAADGLIRDTRTNLAVAVRDLVQESVDRALQRRTDQ